VSTAERGQEDWQMHDVIVVGARCAGSPLALLLARAGARVLLVDRATFPSDTLNGHYIQAAGAACLQRWGLLDRVLAGGQPVGEHRLNFGPLSLTGQLTWPDGRPAVAIAPRRRRLDALLATAASEAGAELRQRFTVDDLLWEGDRVVGIRGRGPGGAAVERARVVVGADGFRSRVAAAVGAASYEVRPAQTCAYYSHWADLPSPALELYARPGRYALLFPSDDGLACLAVGWPRAEFGDVRRDVERQFMAEVERVPALAERVRAARRVEPFRGTGDLPAFLRTPHGPGWALVGDAGCRVDPITGQGISDAFRDAELLAEALAAGLGGQRPLEAALADYHRRRDEAVMRIYNYTYQRSRLEPPTPEIQRLLAALKGNQAETDRFVGLTAGTTRFADFFAPDHQARLLAGAAVRAA
jgi:flavin-dependent dehydrogenase